MIGLEEITAAREVTSGPLHRTPVAGSSYIGDLIGARLFFKLAMILERVKVVAEPAAASTLAALLSGKVKVAPGSTVVCVLSGGNIDRQRLKALL